MRQLHWYAVQYHILQKAMAGVVIDTLVEGHTITYRKAKGKQQTIPLPTDDDIYLYVYGSMIMEGYTLVPSPDNTVHLCSGGSAIYNVTDTTCTCPAYTYKGLACKHIQMLKGSSIYRLKAMALRSKAM